MDETVNCVKCGKPACIYAGHLKIIENEPISDSIYAGWCSNECAKDIPDGGCCGIYDKSIHGEIREADFM